MWIHGPGARGENEESKRKKSHRLQEIDDLLIWKMPQFDLSPDEVDSLNRQSHGLIRVDSDLRGNSGGYE